MKKSPGPRADPAPSNCCWKGCSLVVDEALIYLKHSIVFKTGEFCSPFVLVLCLFLGYDAQEPTLNFSGVDLCILNQEIDLCTVLVVLFSPPYI